MGIAALLPGITHMREILMQQENEYRDLLRNLQNNGLELLPKKRGRPSKASIALLEAQQLLPAAITEPPPPKKMGHGETLPHMIGKSYTRNGAAAYLGYSSIGAFDLFRRRVGIVSTLVKNPEAGKVRGGRVMVTAFSRAALDAARKQRDGNIPTASATEEPKKRSTEVRQALSKHQKNYWYGMTKEQRTAEVARRMGKKKVKGKQAQA